MVVATILTDAPIGEQVVSAPSLFTIRRVGALVHATLSGPIGRFVRRITLRELIQRTSDFAAYAALFLAALRCNGRTILRSAAPECQS